MVISEQGRATASAPSETTDADEESRMAIVETTLQVAEDQETKEMAFRGGTDSDEDEEIIFVPTDTMLEGTKAVDETLDFAIHKMERRESTGDSIPVDNEHDQKGKSSSERSGASAVQSMAKCRKTRKNDSDRQINDQQKSGDVADVGFCDDETDNLPMFAILIVFGVALSLVGCFHWIPSIKNTSFLRTLAFAFGTVPLIALVLVSIWGYNKKKIRGKNDHESDADSEHNIVVKSSQDFESFYELYNKAKDAEEEEKETLYPEDSYSFLAVYSPYGKYKKFFFFGLIVWLLQIAFLLLMALNVIVPALRTTGEVDNTESGSWFGRDIFPSNSGHLVRATQVLSLMAFVFFPEESLLDVTKAFALYPFRTKLVKDADKSVNAHGWKIWGLRLSCAMRFLQAALSTLAVWLLVMTASDVVDIILNFTAINFISGIDDKAFELAKSGNYGKRMKKAAENISKKELPDIVQEHSEHFRHKCGIVVTCFIIYAATIGVMVTQDNIQKWVTPIVRVEFQDELRTDYSGCYLITEEMHYQRYVWKGYKNRDQSAKIGYCLDKRRWLLFRGETDPCKALGTANEVAHSAKTDSYEIQSSIQEDWFSAFNTPLDNMYFYDSKGLSREDCSSFPGNGVCDRNLNHFEYQYDGGDCCEIGIHDNPNCEDPSVTPVTFQLEVS